VRPRFHLAFPVTDLEATRRFYADVLGARVGRTDARWIDFDFWDHQISAHLVDAEPDADATNAVDGDRVPVRHFGIILPWDEWQALGARLRSAGVPFLVEPRVRFAGQVGEQGTLFVTDPSGNALEFKSFRDMSRVFAS
jgi:extradiol dioxygenase family protein